MKENKTGKKVLAIILWILLLCSAVFTGFMGSMAVSTGNMLDMRSFDVENYKEFYPNLEEDEIRELILDDKWWVYTEDEHTLQDAVEKDIYMVIAGAVIILACWVILGILAGSFKRNEDETIILSWFDKVWSEIQFAFLSMAGTGAVCCAYPIYEIWPCIGHSGITPTYPDEYLFGLSNDGIIILSLIGMAVCIAVFTLFLLSYVKKIKAKAFFKYSFIGIIFGWLTRLFGKIRDDVLRNENLKTKYFLIAFGMVFLAMTWIGAVIDIAIIIIYLPKLVEKFKTIREGTERVKSGELSYQIPYEADENGPKGDLDRLARDINEISQATNIAVQNEIKNQRLKTDLISNVSHDLKTPLTSMISYVDLLKTEGLDSENAPEYLDILEEKTLRLKSLTENLFEAAKASSGNIPCTIEDIDISAIVSQSLGELEEKLESRNLNVIVKNELEKARVLADGQLLWRVIENLLTNVSKYALDGSRVYINLSNIGEAGRSRVLLEVKNISQDPLNIPADELMERFKRGDESRNTEGSGLGLAIAKDLTSLMGGIFEISIDGDLFKATILLDCAE